MALVAGVFAFAAPAAADRPGTPNNVTAHNCSDSILEKPQVCFEFDNTASETVKIEIRTTRDGPLVKLESKCEPSTRCYMENVAYPGISEAERKDNPGRDMNLFTHRAVNLDYDATYCASFRARRVSDDMVSDIWSAAGCVRTEHPPAVPDVPVFSLKLLGSQWLANPRREIPETLQIAYTQGDRAGKYVATVYAGDFLRGPLPGTFVFDQMRFSGGLQPSSFAIPPTAQVLTVQVCAVNITGSACARHTANVENSQIDGFMAPRPGLRSPGSADGPLVQAGRPGLPIAGSGGGSPVPVGAMAGMWSLTTNSNIHYDLLLALAPGNIGNIGNMNDTMVQGNFTNTDGVPAYDGSLQGIIRFGERTVIFTYAQPGSKTGGHGELTLSSDGSSLSGSGFDGPSKAQFTWGGPRKQ